MSDFERHFKLKTHLKVIGTILESSEIYANRRKELFENLILQSIQLVGGPASILDILKVLQYNKCPLINKGKLISIVNQLKSEKQLDVTLKNKKEYYTLVENPTEKTSSIHKQLKKSYRRFVFNSSDKYFDQFQEVLVQVFSELGISTVNHLFVKKQTFTSSIEEIIDRKKTSIEGEDFQEFKEGILSFFESDLEEATKIKIALAQAYTALKMMGIGNWQTGELDKILKGKQLLIDSNVLFSYISSQEKDDNVILEFLKSLKDTKEVMFLIGHETKHEFFKAFSHQLNDLRNLYKKNVNVNLFHESNAFDLDWFPVFKAFSNGKSPIDTIDDFYQYVETLICNLLESLNCKEQHLDTIDIENVESSKEKELSDIIREKSRRPKSSSALKHDCLLWEYLEENQSIRLFTHDSIWRYVKINKDTKSINAGDLFLYFTIGSYDSIKLSGVLNHVIKGNILQANNVLSLDEISALANAEEKVLALPRAKRRELISKIHDFKKSKLDSGQPLVSQEVSALAFSYLVSIESNVSEENQVKYLESQLKEKSQKIEEYENRNKDLESSLSKSSEEISQFKQDKFYILWAILALIMTSISAHFLHQEYNVGWTTLLVPILAVLFYTIVGILKGFEKSWVIVTTVVALIFTILPTLNINVDTKGVAEKELVDKVETKASSILKREVSNE